MEKREAAIGDRGIMTCCVDCELKSMGGGGVVGT